MPKTTEGRQEDGKKPRLQSQAGAGRDAGGGGSTLCSAVTGFTLAAWLDVVMMQTLDSHCLNSGAKKQIQN